MTRDHCQRDKPFSARGDVQAGERNQSFASATLGHDRSRASFGKPPHNATDRNRLGRVRPAKQLCQQRRRQVLRAVQRRKRLEDSFPKLSRECLEILTYRCGPLDKFGTSWG